MNFLANEELEQSGIVANCRMNRERNLCGSNGYSRELRFNPLDFLKEKAESKGHASWLDLCCGTGKALVEAGSQISEESLPIEIVGVDLVGMFLSGKATPTCLKLIQASLSTWDPDEQFDLITCVHGLHYVGDKLGLITRAASWLTVGGRFVANLDLKNIKLDDDLSAERIIAKELRRQGFEYDFRRHLILSDTRRTVDFPFKYLGANDQAGPNYTGQPAVNSHYQVEDAGKTW